MSDFRFAGYWLNDRRIITLSPEDFKAFVTAGAFMVENRTDGHIGPDDLSLIPRFNPSSVDRLVAAGVWDVAGNGWQMVDYDRTQTSRAEFQTLDNMRRADREKKKRQRAHKAGDHTMCPQPCLSPGTSPGQSPVTRQARRELEIEPGEASYDSADWPVADIPSGAR